MSTTFTFIEHKDAFGDTVIINLTVDNLNNRNLEAVAVINNSRFDAGLHIDYSGRLRIINRIIPSHGTLNISIPIGQRDRLYSPATTIAQEWNISISTPP